MNTCSANFQFWVNYSFKMSLNCFVNLNWKWSLVLSSHAVQSIFSCSFQWSKAIKLSHKKFCAAFYGSIIFLDKLSKMLTNHQKYCQSMKETELIEESYILYAFYILKRFCLWTVFITWMSSLGFSVFCYEEGFPKSTFYWMQRWPECDWFSGLLHVSSNDIARASLIDCSL